VNMTQDGLYRLDELIDSGRLAAKWVVDHADRAHEYDRGYASEALLLPTRGAQDCPKGTLPMIRAPEISR
jgi:hypothetical protein